MTEQKEPNQKSREMMIYYTPMYNLIVQSKMLSQTERTLAVLISSYHGLGCNWARESLKDYCECGPYHLDRSIKRLQFMHIIRVLPGPPRRDGSKRREKNRYIFEPDPYHWRVTKEMQELIVQETLAMKKEPRPFVYDCFPNNLGLEIAFAKTFPRYAKGKKGRRKKIGDPQTAETELDTESTSLTWDEPAPETESQKWRRKTNFIMEDALPFIELAMDYYSNLKGIEKLRNDPNHGFSHHKQTYLERLHAIYTDRRRSLKGDDIEIFNKIEIWLDEKLSALDIQMKLGQLNMERKMSQEG